ncbi:helix-turn-helix domain-containing protein [Leifsonia poae]|uniref:helix-turn-helix domain-containing protein n=1 Tax=Leifsonia poae TaxID=110933 RepID=UPI001CBBF227|nr:helix-turn-helix transcriptional regulator [Leifsonia poae]
MAERHSRAAQILGERVRTARMKLGLSQESVADLAQMHVTNFGKIERGSANPSLHTIVRISSVLGIDPAILIGGLDGDDLPAALRVLTAAEFMRERRNRTRR